MNKKELLEYIRFFREKANNSKLIVFVGAGVSCNVDGMPDWNTLICKMAEAIKYSRCSFCRNKSKGCDAFCEVKEKYFADEFLKIPQYVYNKSKKLYNQVLVDNIRDVDVDAPLSNAIVELDPVHIITTNYDRLIENCESAKRDNFEVIVNDKDLLRSKKNKYIIKMHGDVRQPETIVLKESDYLEYSQKHVLIEMFVKSLLANHTILFLGYSLNDYNIKLIISWINYIRMQNHALNSDTKFGYIVVDSKKMSLLQKKYYEENNIGVINLKNMPMIDDIPATLQNDVGKRLYSFVKTIKDFSLERNFGEHMLYEKSIQFMKKYAYVDCKNICSLLCLGKYYRNGTELTLFSTTAYDSLVSFLKRNTEDASYVAQLFVDAGICIIELVAEKGSRRDVFTISEMRESILKEKNFQLYLFNKYVELLDNYDKNDVFQNCFYKSIINGYTDDIYKIYSEINVEDLSEEKKVVYLFNFETLEMNKTFYYSGNRANRYINSIPDIQQKNMYQIYLDIYDGNTDNILKMRNRLSKLKEQYKNRNHRFVACNSLQELFGIRAIAMEQYSFYYRNHLFFEGMTDLNKILKPYIEAMICTNGQLDEETKDSFFKSAPKLPYEFAMLDIDIMIKHIALKELNNLLQEYKVEQLNINSEMATFIVDCFENLASTMVSLKLHYRFSNIFANYMLILFYTPLHKALEERISGVITELLQNDNFLAVFFSTKCPEWRMCLKIMNQLMKKLTFNPDFGLVKKLILGKNFWDYYANVNLYHISSLLDNFIDTEKLQEIQPEINEFICSFEGRKRIDVTKILKNSIMNDSSKIHIQYISEHYDELDTDDILLFSFANWLELTKENKEKIIEETKQLHEIQKVSGVHNYPNPLEINMELICLLFITGKIEDISGLATMKDENVFLEFFLDDNFDYEKVDLSNYMWVNIARRSRFMEKIQAHRDKVIPKIQKRIQLDTATEFEKKILYGYLLDKSELL